jgi:membrane protease YdiL (CAAX protease family)
VEIKISLMLLSLVVLAWPRLRGVDWPTIRHDIGWHWGRGALAELGAGAMTYAMALPILAVGLMFTAVLMAIQQHSASETPGPSHPVQELIASGGWWTGALVMLIGVVVAPIVEETVFRGLLYRHLREATGRLGFALSMTLGAIVTSVLFAAVHPQGWTFIPVLSSLAVAFCIGREWRGSLAPCIVAHGLNNAVMLSLNFVILAGD